MASLFPDEFLEEVRTRLAVSDVVGKRVKLKKKGNEFVGLSPFQIENTPSFFVNDQKFMWFDFSSGANGDIFDFVMRTEGCEFPEAVERCAAQAGLPLPARTNGAAADAGKRLALIEIVEAAAAFYEQALLEPAGAAAREYLAARGVAAPAIARFRIGFAPDARFALKEYLGAKGIPVEDMIAAGLLIHGDDIPVPYDRFRDRVMFPITDLKGRVIAFGGRAIDVTTNPKYLNSADSTLFHKGQVLYHAAGARPAVQKGSQLIVVEGYLDVVSMVAASFEGAVAPLGTALTAEQLALLWRIHPEPCLCFDGDGAGRRAAYRAIDLALPLICAEKRLTFVLLPEGQDPDELARAHGPTGMARIMSGRMPLSELLWMRETGAPMDTPEACALVQKRLADCVGLIADEGLRALYRQDFKVRLDGLFARARGAGSEDPGAGVDVTQGGLYRGADIGEALATERIIVVAETEAAVDALSGIGLPATTAPGGAGAWETRHSLELQAADVLVVGGPKSDAAVKRMCTALQGHTARLRTLMLPAEVETWVGDGGTAEGIYERAARSREFTAEPWRSKFGGKTWEELGTTVERPYAWTVENIIPEGESVVFFGESGSGKSFDSLEMAMCLTRGLAFNGFNVEQGLVIYVAAEAGKGFEKRKVAYCQHHGLDLKARLPFYLLTKRANLFRGEEDTTALIAEIQAICSLYDAPLRAIFLDTVSALTPGMNENASQDTSMVRAHIDRIKDTFGVSTILVHHTAKGGDSPRGHGSFTADFETTIRFETVEGRTDAAGNKVHRGTLVKQREGKTGVFWEFTLPIVRVGTNKWGNAETSCVVAPISQQTADRGAAKVTPQQRRFLEALFEALDASGIVPPPELNLPRAVARVVDYRYVKTLFAKRELNDGDDPRDHSGRLRKALSDARKHLGDRRIIGSDNPYIWWAGRPVDGVKGARRSSREIPDDQPPLPPDAGDFR